MTGEEQNHSQTPKEVSASTLRRRKHVAGNRANAQREKLDAQAEARSQRQEQEAKETTRKPYGKHEQQRLLANRRANTTIAHAIEDYLQDHAGATIVTRRWSGTARPWD
jgi:hypothetical protein